MTENKGERNKGRPKSIEIKRKSGERYRRLGEKIVERNRMRQREKKIRDGKKVRRENVES